MTTWMLMTYVYVAIFLFIFVVLTIWVIFGGIRDAGYLIKSLKEEIVDDTDDGRV